MDDVYIPPEFIDSYLLPYLTELIEADFTEAKDIYEFSACYFENKTRERDEKEKKKCDPLLRLDKNQSSELIVKNTEKLLFKERKAEDEVKEHSAPQDQTMPPTKRSTQDEQVEKKGKVEREEQYFVKQKKMPTNAERNPEIIYQIGEFTDLLPQYISVMLDVLDNLDQNARDTTMKKLLNSKDTVCDKKTALNTGNKNVSSRLKNADSQTSSFGGKISPSCSLKNSSEHHNGVLLMSEDNKDGIVKEEGRGRDHDQVLKAAVPQNVEKNSILDEPPQKCVTEEAESLRRDQIEGAQVSKKTKPDSTESDVEIDLLLPGNENTDLTNNKEFRYREEEYQDGETKPDVDPIFGIQETTKECQDGVTNPDVRSMFGAQEAAKKKEDARFVDAYMKKILRERERLLERNSEVEDKDRKYFILQDTIFQENTRHSTRVPISTIPSLDESSFQTPYGVSGRVENVGDDEAKVCEDGPKEKKRGIVVSEAPGVQHPVDRHRATETLKDRMRSLICLQNSEKTGKQVSGNGRTNYEEYEDKTGVSITGKSWLRAYLTVQTIRQVRGDDWTTLFVEGQDDDLGQPLWVPPQNNIEDESSLDVFGLFKAFRTWFFAKKIREFQNELDCKE